MEYFKEIYWKPVVVSIKNWKKILFSAGIDGIAILLCYFVFNVLLFIALRFLRPLGAHNLEDIDILMLNAPRYAIEARNFYFVSIISLILFFVFAYAVYSLSRTIVWNKVLGSRNNFLRNLFIHALHFFTAFIIFAFFVFAIQDKYLIYFSIAFLFPWLYYSFFCNMNLNQKTIKAVFKKAFSVKLALLLPHFFILLLFLITLNSLITYYIINIIFIVVSFAFFRVYIYEAGKRIDRTAQ